MPTDLWPENGERFMRKVELNGPGGCWPWVAAVHADRGAGLFALYEQGKKRLVLGHTAAWALFVGPPPNNKTERLGATCGKPLCCNPQHLFVERMKGTGVSRRSSLTYAQKIEKKFWEHVAPSADLQCLLYSPTRPSGYPMIYFLVEGKRTGMPAQRYAMSLKHGPIARDVMVKQTCGNKACVSLTHLYLAQPGFYAKGKEQKHEPCGQRGELRPGAKLKADDIPQIFHWARVKGYSYAEIAQHVGVKPSTIKNVLKRQTWRHVNI